MTISHPAPCSWSLAVIVIAAIARPVAHAAEVALEAVRTAAGSILGPGRERGSSRRLVGDVGQPGSRRSVMHDADERAVQNCEVMRRSVYSAGCDGQ